MNNTPNNQTVNPEDINNEDELKNDFEFQKNKETFKNLVKKYLGYRSDGNKSKINEFLNGLDVTNFNKILNYFEEQRDRTKNFQIKQDLAMLYSDILNNRNSSITESREKLYARNAVVTFGKISQTDEKTGEKKQYEIIGSTVEVSPNGYGISLDYGDWGKQYFHVDTSNNSLVVTDEHNNPLKCNVELLDIDMRKENIGLGQQRIISIKEYRIQIGNQYFVLKFND